MAPGSLQPERTGGAWIKRPEEPCPRNRTVRDGEEPLRCLPCPRSGAPSCLGVPGTQGAGLPAAIPLCRPRGAGGQRHGQGRCCGAGGDRAAGGRGTGQHWYSQPKQLPQVPSGSRSQRRCPSAREARQLGGYSSAGGVLPGETLPPPAGHRGPRLLRGSQAPSPP